MVRALTHAPGPAIARHPRATGAAVLAFATSGLTLALALALVSSPGRPASSDGKAIFSATSGPHVAVYAMPGVNLGPIADLPGVSAASGPFQSVDTGLRYHGREVGVRLEARPAAATAVDQPLLVSGHWVRPRTVVLERNTARTLRVPLGGTVMVATTHGRVRLTVGGFAETVARSRYPGDGRGLGYALLGTLAGVAPTNTYGSTMLLRLADPDRAGKYAQWIKQRYPGGQVAVEEPSP